MDAGATQEDLDEEFSDISSEVVGANGGMNSDFAIIAEYKNYGKRVVEIDTNKAHYKGIPWKDLGGFGKQKFENLIVMMHTKASTKVRYT